MKFSRTTCGRVSEETFDQAFHVCSFFGFSETAMFTKDADSSIVLSTSLFEVFFFVFLFFLSVMFSNVYCSAAEVILCLRLAGAVSEKSVVAALSEVSDWDSSFSSGATLPKFQSCLKTYLLSLDVPSQMEESQFPPFWRVFSKHRKVLVGMWRVLCSSPWVSL